MDTIAPVVKYKKSVIEGATAWIGSIQSLVVHTLFFAVTFLVGAFHLLTWELVLLVLMTVVSLEAIYLAIFIQMTVNRHDESLRDVKEDIGELGEDVEDIQENIGELGEDVVDIQENIEELTEEDLGENDQRLQMATLESLIVDLKQVLAKVEAFKSCSHGTNGGVVNK